MLRRTSRTFPFALPRRPNRHKFGGVLTDVFLDGLMTKASQQSQGFGHSALTFHESPYRDATIVRHHPAHRMPGRTFPTTYRAVPPGARNRRSGHRETAPPMFKGLPLHIILADRGWPVAHAHTSTPRRHDPSNGEPIGGTGLAPMEVNRARLLQLHKPCSCHTPLTSAPNNLRHRVMLYNRCASPSPLPPHPRSRRAVIHRHGSTQPLIVMATPKPAFRVSWAVTSVRKDNIIE